MDDIKTDPREEKEKASFTAYLSCQLHHKPVSPSTKNREKEVIRKAHINKHWPRGDGPPVTNK
jgi:hypothetical protein